MSTVRRRVAVILGLLSPVALLQAAAAQPVAPGPLTMEALATVLTNMGYEPKVQSSGKFAEIQTRDYTITFSLSQPGGELLAYIYLQLFTEEQAGRLDMRALLLANDAGPSYFSLAKSEDTWKLYLQRSMPSAGATTVNLRRTIENLETVGDDSEDLWNTSRWKPG